MTVRCAWCKKIMDEICPECGSNDLEPIEVEETTTWAYKCHAGDCPNSKTIFPQGGYIGEYTDGICKSCSERERAKIMEAVT